MTLVCVINGIAYDINTTIDIIKLNFDRDTTEKLIAQFWGIDEEDEE